MEKRGPSQRQLRVGEEIKHALSMTFMQNQDYKYHPGLEKIVGITVSEVRVSPDLKNATAYVMPLGGDAPDDYIKSLNELAPQFRSSVNRLVALKYSPKIFFRHDDSYEEAQRINTLLQTIKSEEPSLEAVSKEDSQADD